MCGRYTIAKPKRIIKRHFDPIIMKCKYRERYNVAPGQNTPVVTLQDGQHEMNLMRWGLIPPWTKNNKNKNTLINARSETIHQKPSFKDSFQTRRCLIPADGFIEWKEKEKFPNYIFLKSKDIFAFAGIWTKWDKEALPIYSFSIITTQANTKVAAIHERMPVIIDPSNYKLWLTHHTNSRALLDLLSPFNSEKMESYQISKEINSYKNDHDNLLSPISLQ